VARQPGSVGHGAIVADETHAEREDVLAELRTALEDIREHFDTHHNHDGGEEEEAVNVREKVILSLWIQRRLTRP